MAEVAKLIASSGMTPGWPTRFTGEEASVGEAEGQYGLPLAGVGLDGGDVH